MKQLKKILLVVITIVSFFIVTNTLTNAENVSNTQNNFIIGRVGNAGRSGSSSGGSSFNGSNFYNSNSSYSSFDSSDFLDFMILFRLFGNEFSVVFVILFLYYIKILLKRNQYNTGQQYNNNYNQTNIVHRNIEKEVQEHDPEFDERKFIAHVQKAYLIVTNAWSTLDMTKATQYVTPDYADTLTIQLQEFIRNKTKNINEAVEFLRTELIDYNNDGIVESLTVEIYLSDIDYIVDNNNRIVEGSKKRQYVTLTIELLRKVGSKTKVFETETHCPSCHAPMKLDISGKCAYCDTLYQVDQDNWLINNIKV